MNKILAGLPGILIIGSSEEEYNTNVLPKLQTTGVTLNRSKCEFGKERLMFWGHVLAKKGISADPSKTKAILAMCRPRTPTELRRFLGMVNQLGKFTTRVVKHQECMVWGTSQDKSFEAIN